MATVRDDLADALRPRTGGPEATLPTDGYAIAAFVTALLGFLPLPLALALIALSRTRHRGTRGRGFAIAALWISGAWVVITVLLVVVLLAGFLNAQNADDYTGTKREVAVVIDRYEDRLTDDDATGICDLMTTPLRDALVMQSGSCEAAVGSDDGGLFAHLDAKEITITAPDHAVALVEDPHETFQMTFVREAGQWRIDEIGDAPE